VQTHQVLPPLVLPLEACIKVMHLTIISIGVAALVKSFIKLCNLAL